MDKNTPPLSSLPSSEHNMESKVNETAKNKVEQDPTEPSAEVIRTIQNFSKALAVEPTKSDLQFVEYIKN